MFDLYIMDSVGTYSRVFSDVCRNICGGNCVGLVLVTHSRGVGTQSPMLFISDAVEVTHSRSVGTHSPMLSIRVR